MHSTSRFPQGVPALAGKGRPRPVPVGVTPGHVLRAGVAAQAVSFRGGDSATAPIRADLGMVED